MTILSDISIRERLAYGSHTNPDSPFKLCIEPFSEAKQFKGMSYGLGPAGYDIRIGKIDRKYFDNPVQAYRVHPGEFVLLSSLEKMTIPHDIVGKVHDKSTLARKGLALQNTVLEPGWTGHITLELSNHSDSVVQIFVGQPIAQVIFYRMDKPTSQPYKGKYQNQPNHPVEAIILEDQ